MLKSTERRCLCFASAIIVYINLNNNDIFIRTFGHTSGVQLLLVSSFTGSAGIFHLSAGIFHR